eukprot:m51a1_g6431 putative domain containing protein (837) ;mRNA; f:357541-360795
MPLCRPVPAATSSVWTDIKTSDCCLLQKHTLPWVGAWRVVTRYTPYLLAESQRQEEAEADWSRVQRVLADDVPAPADAVVILLAHMHAAWARAAAASLPEPLSAGGSAQQPPPLPTSAAPGLPAAAPEMPPPPAKKAPAPLLGQQEVKRLINETRLWEEKRDRFFKGVKGIFAKHTATLRAEFEKYVRDLREVGNAQGLGEPIMSRMEEEERKAFDGLSRMMFGERSACVRVVEDEIAKRREAFAVVNDVIRIQKIVRGWLARRKFRETIKKLKHRTKVVKEMLETERTYVESIELLLCEFLAPLRKNAESDRPFISSESIASLFSNIELLVNINKELLAALDEKLKNWNSTKTCIGEMLVKMVPYLKAYKQYVNSYDGAMVTLKKCLENPEFKSWHEATYNRQNKKLPIEGYLIMPVQRIPRYSLLMKDLVENTPDLHPDLPFLREAMTRIKQIASDINEAKRKQDGQKKIVEVQQMLGEQLPDLIQPHRVFIKEGMVVRDCDEVLQPCTLILFNDLVLVTQRKRGFDGSYYYALIDSIKLFYATASSYNTNKDTKFKYGFAVKSKLGTWRFLVEKKSERDEWMSEFDELLERLKANMKTLRRSPESELVLDTTPSSESAVAAQQQTSSGSGSLSATLTSTSSLELVAQKRDVSTAHLRAPSMNAQASARDARFQAQLLLQSAKVKDVLKLYNEVLELEKEIMGPPIEIKSLMPQYTQGLHPDLQTRLKPRLDLLAVKLVAMEQLHIRAMTLLRDKGLFSHLNKTIQDGLSLLDPLRMWISAYTKDIQAQARAGVQIPPHLYQPAKLIRPLLNWYLDLSQAWELVSESDVEGESS